MLADAAREVFVAVDFLCSCGVARLAAAGAALFRETFGGLEALPCDELLGRPVSLIQRAMASRPGSICRAFAARSLASTLQAAATLLQSCPAANPRGWSPGLDQRVHVVHQLRQFISRQKRREAKLAEGVDLALKGFGRETVCHFHSHSCCHAPAEAGRAS